MSRLPTLVAVLVSACAASGCLVVGRADPPPPPPVAPATAPRMEYALGEFVFRMNDGDPKPSYFDGRLLGAAIFETWEERGYVSDVEHVDPDEFSPEATYHVTITGNVHAHTSFWAELLNVLTLLTVPYSVVTRYDVQLMVERADGGPAYLAQAQTVDETWVGLLLIPGFPFAERGFNEETARLADTLYAELQAQGLKPGTAVADRDWDSGRLARNGSAPRAPVPAE